ncbi:MAG: hypothetical protein LCI02_17665 [Proteobacteria bacterium]|nr:hypothetical protein [Pseudomonadota bacterium]
MFKRALGILCLAASALASAQTPSAFLGTWTVTWDGGKRPQQARLVITESGGTWKQAASTKLDPCLGREVPVSLEGVDGDAATIHLKFSEALPGCTDVKIKVRKLNDKALAGTRGQAEVAFARE